MKIGISSGCYAGISVEREIELLQKNGVDATFLGCDENTADTVKKMRQAGIEVDNFHAPFHNVNAIWLPGEAGELALKQFTDAAELAAKTEVPLIVVHLSSGVTPPMISDVGNERFARLMKRAGELGVTVAYENQRKLANLALMFEYYPEARFCWDVGHEACFANGMEYMPLFGDKLAALHIHDNLKIFNEDLHRLPYDGAIDFDRTAEQIAKSGYEGTVMLETWNGPFYQGVTDEEFVARAASAARRLADTIEKYKN